MYASAASVSYGDTNVMKQRRAYVDIELYEQSNERLGWYEKRVTISMEHNLIPQSQVTSISKTALPRADKKMYGDRFQCVSAPYPLAYAYAASIGAARVADCN